MMEKKMETTTMGLYYKDYIRAILELDWDNGKWKLLQWGYIGILLGLYWGYNRIMENKWKLTPQAARYLIACGCVVWVGVVTRAFFSQ